MRCWNGSGCGICLANRPRGPTRSPKKLAGAGFSRGICSTSREVRLARDVTITFDDQSTLKLKVAGQAMVAVGTKVKAVHESGERFQVDLEGGPRVQVRLADSGASVALRDKSGAVEYLG